MRNAAAIKRLARRRIAEMTGELADLSHRILALPELAFEEHNAARWIADALACQGFTVQRGCGGLPTAISGAAGHGDLVIGFCAEYDALPRIGHACGHNIIAAAAVGAAVAAASVADCLGVSVRLIGTPAEERGGGKILLMERGVFDGVHAVMEIHPGPFDMDYVQCRPLACAELRVIFSGGDGGRGAAEIAGPGALLHADVGRHDFVDQAVIHQGGSETVMRFSLRAATLDRLRDLELRAGACFERAASRAAARVTVHYEEPPYAHFRGDADLEACYAANLTALGRAPGAHPSDVWYSTDLGNVSLRLPAIHPTTGIDAGTAVNHDPEFAAHCGGASADAAVQRGATAMAWTAIDAAINPAIRDRLLRDG